MRLDCGCPQNFFVVALDKRTADFLERRDAPHYVRELCVALRLEFSTCSLARRSPRRRLARHASRLRAPTADRRSRSGSTDNHATSGLKFRILGEILSVGCSVLLTDVDVVLTRDPFPALYRDSDAEGM